MKTASAIKAALLMAAAMLPSALSASGLSYADRQAFACGHIDLDHAGPLVLGGYPCALPGYDLMFQSSYRQLYGMKELTDSRMAASAAYHQWIFGAGMAFFGEADYFQQIGLALSASYRLDDFILGGALLYKRFSFNETYDALSCTAANVGATYQKSLATLFGVLRNLNSPRLYEGDDPIRPQWEFGCSLSSLEGLDNQFKVQFEEYRKPTAQLSQLFQAYDYLSLRWNLVLLPVSFGAGMNIEWGDFGFGYDFSHHPVLGAVHTVSISFF